MLRYVVDELSKLATNSPLSNKTTDKNNNINSPNTSLTNQTSTKQISLIDEYDWFKQNYQIDSNKSLKNNNINKKDNTKTKQTDDSVSLTSSFESYYEDLNKEFRFDNLNKFYSPNTNFKQRSFKMLTSYDKDEFMYTYLDNDADIELVESLKTNTLKAVRVFQKSYYQEPIRGELIRVPSWRMKDRKSVV